MDAIFVDGIPAKITIHDFRRYHLQSFPILADTKHDELLTNAIDTVYAMFVGINDMWDLHRNKQIWYEKTTLCYRMLTAWFITDQYPEFSTQFTEAGIIKRKKIDGVDITFNTDRFKEGDPLSWLQSNDFGRKALMLMQTAPRRALLRVVRFA